MTQTLSEAVAARWSTVMITAFPTTRRLPNGVWVATNRERGIEVSGANEPDVLTAFGATVLGLTIEPYCVCGAVLPYDHNLGCKHTIRPTPAQVGCTVCEIQA